MRRTLQHTHTHSRTHTHKIGVDGIHGKKTLEEGKTKYLGSTLNEPTHNDKIEKRIKAKYDATCARLMGITWRHRIANIRYLITDLLIGD